MLEQQIAVLKTGMAGSESIDVLATDRVDKNLVLGPLLLVLISAKYEASLLQ